MIGYFGEIIFETSDKKINNILNFTRESTSRVAVHELIGQKPVPEFIGPGLDKVTFTVNLNGNFGVKPREEMGKWNEMASKGEAHYLVIGGKALGDDQWIISSVSEMWDTIFNNGEVFSGKVDVILEEYISRL